MPDTGRSRADLVLLTVVGLLATMVVGCYPAAERSRTGPHPKSSVSEVRNGKIAEGPAKTRESDLSRSFGPRSIKQERVLSEPAQDPSANIAHGRVDALSRKKQPKPKIEKLSGYEIPCEYFRISSARYPEGVTAVCLPPDYRSNPEKRYPLVIAFGGAGECARPSLRSALAWVDYYQSDQAVKALQDSHLESRDFKGLAGKKEIAEFNARLKRNPYRGVILACPASPPLALLRPRELPRYEEFIMKELVPALKSHYRVDPEGLGVDGVSMGGARSMYYGLKYPETFHSIGAIQGAFGPYMDVYRSLIRAKRKIISSRPIQLVTSDGDVMAPSVKRMSRLLETNGIFCDLRELSGPHDYIFNQGPGSLALLTFHDEALRRSSAGPTNRSQ
jgi:iron(III)-salmochelin esterase